MRHLIGLAISSIFVFGIFMLTALSSWTAIHSEEKGIWIIWRQVVNLLERTLSFLPINQWLGIAVASLFWGSIVYAVYFLIGRMAKR